MHRWLGESLTVTDGVPSYWSNKGADPFGAPWLIEVHVRNQSQCLILRTGVEE